MLAAKFNIHESRLIAAWNSLSAGDRQRYAIIAHQKNASLEDQNLQVDIILKLFSKFPGTTQATQDQLTFYFDAYAFMSTER